MRSDHAAWAAERALCQDRNVLAAFAHPTRFDLIATCFRHARRFRAIAFAACALLLWIGTDGFAQETARSAIRSNPALKLRLVNFDNSPFPYAGEIPESGKPFLDVVSGDRRGHTSPRGGVYWEDRAYSDRHVLLFIPKKFDPHQPVVLVVYLHGNLVRLERDIRHRQQVP